ncbi:protein kinase [Actinomadura sp. 9N407]|uniref:protein kinase domain-containing protein n=1 Tax=Actinomadura sp. 9N407 TaxID=3375154 RepID=UPI00378F780D
MTAVRPLLPGDPARLGPYEVRGRLGEGGQSVVFLGRREDGPEVAIKLLRAQLSQNPEWRARFQRELELIGRVAGFCTAQVLDSDVAGELPYVVSEYVPGPSLTEAVTGAGPRIGTELDRLAIGTVTALAAIHRAGILHRDFKPANVLMGPDGPRVIDFGIARVLGSAAAKGSGVVGTPSYMAPEQVTDTELGTPVDMFAWAATILFAATGRHPFGNDTISAVFHRILNYQPDLSPLPDSLRPTVTACLDKDPARRPEAQQVLLDLLGREETVPDGTEGALTTGASFAGMAVPPTAPQPVPAPPTSSQPGPSQPASSQPTPAGLPVPAHPSTHPPGATLPPPKRRRYWRIAAIVAPVLLLVGGGTAWALMGDGEPPPPQPQPAADTVSPPAEAVAVLGVASESVKAVLSYDYRRIDQDVATAHARSTQRYRAEYDRQLTAENWRVRLRENQSTIATEVAETAVVASAPGTVTVLSHVKRTIGSANAEPQLRQEPMRATLVRQGGSWLLDTLYVLNAVSVPAATPAAGGWPGAKARAVTDAVRGAKEVAAGTLVEAALRAGGSAQQMNALVTVGECTKGACKAGDKVAVYRMVVQQQSDGAWKVGRTERL